MERIWAALLVVLLMAQPSSTTVLTTRLHGLRAARRCKQTATPAKVSVWATTSWFPRPGSSRRRPRCRGGCEASEEKKKVMRSSPKAGGRIPLRRGTSGRGSFSRGSSPRYSSAMPSTARGARSFQEPPKSAVLQFRSGYNESSVPDVKLSKSKDGTSRTATFVFEHPDVIRHFLEAPIEQVLTGGFIQGLFMVDEEGSITTYDLDSVFTNGKPTGVVARYLMTTEGEWDRFMRFMTRFAESNGLKFKRTPRNEPPSARD